ncbi:hydroxyacid dehydrogenase [Planctomycetaceae bacterium SCGC AG-212-F19]|nr:hydroxyacid dehydrogenase [Planctomycetaceae bacterium SCGC AG-212-F19]
MIKVAVTDYSFDTLDVETAVLEPLGCAIVARRRGSTSAELADLVADADHVITQFAPVNATVIGAMRKVRVIVRYGVGVDNVDLEAARAQGIPVCNVPDYCIDEVADQTLALLLATTRGVVPNCQAVRAGQWKLAVPLPAMRTLAEMTVGVVGFGRLGRAVVRRLLAFGGRVLVYDPVVPAHVIADAGGVPTDLRSLLAESDAVTLHCPSTPQTRRLMNRETIGQMRRGAILVNVSRGDVVDSAALVEALANGHLSAAALDVFDPEPIPADCPLLRMDNVVLSAHVASASAKAARKLRETVAGTVARAIRGEPLVNIVNGVRV